MPDNFLLIDVAHTLVTDYDEIEPTESIGLPSRACVFAYQVNCGATPTELDIALQASIDGSVWATVDVFDETALTDDSVLRIVDPFSAKHVRVDVIANSDGESAVPLTILLLAKTQ